MTTCAHDPAASTLVAVWETGLGSTARTVARLHARTGVREAQDLAETLTELSAAAWRGCTDPDAVRIPAGKSVRSQAAWAAERWGAAA